MVSFMDYSFGLEKLKHYTTGRVAVYYCSLSEAMIISLTLLSNDNQSKDHADDGQQSWETQAFPCQVDCLRS